MRRSHRRWVGLSSVNTAADKDLHYRFFTLCLRETQDLFKVLFRVYPRLSEVTRVGVGYTPWSSSTRYRIGCVTTMSPGRWQGCKQILVGPELNCRWLLDKTQLLMYASSGRIH